MLVFARSCWFDKLEGDVLVNEFNKKFHIYEAH